MRVKVRLYRPHDMDLITLKRDETYHLGIEMKQCLVAYANGYKYIAPKIDTDELPGGYVSKSYQMHIELNPKKPEEEVAINVLKNIRPGYRCAFVKTLFRSSSIYLPLFVFSEDSDIITSRNESFYRFTQDMNKNIESDEIESKDTIELRKENEDKESKKGKSTETNNVDADEFDALFDNLNSLI